MIQSPNFYMLTPLLMFLKITSFSTDCPLGDLQWPDSLPDGSNYPHCQHNQDTVTTITVPNGEIFVTCYSGRQFVSIASYVCSEGYQPNMPSSVRVCRDNGTWSGTTINCGEPFILWDCTQSIQYVTFVKFTITAMIIINLIELKGQQP